MLLLMTFEEGGITTLSRWLAQALPPAELLAFAVTVFGCVSSPPKHHNDDPALTTPGPLGHSHDRSLDFQRLDTEGLSAFHAPLSFVTQLHPDSVVVRSTKPAAPWTLKLSWTEIGRSRSMVATEPCSKLSYLGSKASCWRSDGSEEWLDNQARGLEHGFVIARRPFGDGPLRMNLGIAGDARVEHAQAGSISFVSPSGDVRIHYADLHAYDADGHPVVTSMSAANGQVVITVDDSNAVYPLVIDPLIWTEVIKIQPVDNTRRWWFGAPMALSDDTLFAGSGGDWTGSIFIFERNLGGPQAWGHSHTVLARDGSGLFLEINSIGASGDWLALGIPRDSASAPQSGAVFLHHRTAVQGAPWAQVKTLYAPTPRSNAWFGSKIAMSDNLMVVGAEFDSANGPSAGALYILTKDAGGLDQWGVIKTLLGEADSRYGGAFALNGDTLAIRAVESGRVDVHDRNTGGPDHWGKTATIVEPSTDFGWALALDGDILAVSALGVSAPLPWSGAVFVYDRNRGGTNRWGQVAKLVSSSPNTDGKFGIALSVHKELIAVGAYREDVGGKIDSGSTHVFLRDNGGPGHWHELAHLVANEPVSHAELGQFVALDDTCVVASAPGLGEVDGAVYMFGLGNGYGQDCAKDSECVSGHCVDDVCCNSDCDQANANDCLACSTKRGAATNGICGVVVDGTSCNDGLYCNGSDTCSHGACLGGQQDPCAKTRADDDANCSEACDELSDTCTAAEPEGTPCDDGIFCNGLDRCQHGQCSLAGGSPCAGPDGDEDCSESCDESNRICTAHDPDGVLCGSNGACHNGTCAKLLGLPCEHGSECSSTFCVGSICCAEESCGAYRCGPKGLCHSMCSSSVDCAAGFECASSGDCVQVPQDTSSDSSGCAISPADKRPGSKPTVGILLGILGFFQWAVRRKRSGHARPRNRACEGA